MSAFSERTRSQKKGFFKVADLEGGKELTLTISYLDEEVEIFGETKDLLNFQETGQQLQLNQTTAEWLIDNLGDDPKHWPGKQVVLHLAEFEYNREKKLGVRLKLPGTKSAVKEGVILPPTRGDGAANAAARSSSSQSDRETDLDEIPF